MRKHGKVDTNQAEIVAALTRSGATVRSTASIGNGFADLVVGHRGVNYLMEVKTHTGRMTQDELAFSRSWRGNWKLVFTVDDALKVIGAL